jgi:hypothetical protein
VTQKTRYTALYLLGFAALGLWHHLYFSYSVGEFVFFKNGYDEDTYVLFPFGPAGFRPDRMLSGVIVSAILWFSQGSYNIALMVLDTLLPPLIFLAAYYAGAALFSKFSTRSFFALVLIFATDLFSLGSAASYPGPFPTLDQFKALVGDAFVPPLETSYLGLYRSPEPQVSYVVGFLFIGLILRIVLRDAEKTTRREVVKLSIVQTSLMLCYALVSYPLVLVEGLAAIILLISGRRQDAIILGVLFFGSTIAAFAFGRMTLGSSAMLLFSSRLPVVTVGVILAFALTIIFLCLLLRSGRADRWLMTGLAFSAMPLALTNQQLLTGLMVSAREWERYVDLPFVVVAAGILASNGRWRVSWQIPAVALGTVVVAGFVLASSIRTYKLWLSDNLKSLAITRAVAAADKELADDTLLVFDEPVYAPFVEARLGRPLHALLNYTDVFKNPIPSTPDFSPTLLADALFEYWKQTAVTPAAAMEILQEEARQRGGFYSGFIFNVCEYWYPCTDGRAVKTRKIVAMLPSVVMSYTNFLAKSAPPGKFAFVTLKSLPATSKGEIIGEGRVASIVARVSLRN